MGVTACDVGCTAAPLAILLSSSPNLADDLPDARVVIKGSICSGIVEVSMYLDQQPSEVSNHGQPPCCDGRSLHTK